MQGRFNQAARCTCTGGAAWSLAAALGAAIAIGTTAAPASGQTAEMVFDEVPTAIDSGAVRWDAPDNQGAEPQPVFSQMFVDKDARWLRLEFGVVQLSGSLRDGTGSFLRLTSIKDGGVQILDAVSIQQWGHTSAYFNGNSVLVELFSHPNTGNNRLSITSHMAGGAPAPPIETQCGLFDDRVPSSDPGAARLSVPGAGAFCTAFLISGVAGTNPTCFLSAGHCLPQGGDVCEFDVPPSNADGTVNFSDPDDQYPVDPASVQGQNAGVGNDWVFFGCFQNANTGLFAGEVQAPFPLEPGPGASAEIWMWGYGVENANNFPSEPERNKVQQFEGDSGFTTNASAIFYDQLDTMGGNSGSPVYRPDVDGVIGIHTNGGCAVFGGENKATRIDRPAIQSALANPLGICAFGSDACPGSGSCFYDNVTIGCNNTVCCNAICAADSFCCESSWDSICATAANNSALCADDACPGSGDCFATGGNGSVGCDNAPCCNTVCTVDSFCCSVSWDGLCANQALDICPDAPPTGACCLAFFSGCADNTLEAECIAGGGTWQGPDSSCALVDCFPDCPGEGNCFLPNGTPGCDNNACCESVCAFDDFCCEVTWDSQCAGEAIDLCGFPQCPGTGGCFIPHGSLGCQDLICCNIVCTIDPFCCDVAWDGMCVGAALANCPDAPLSGACCLPDNSCVIAGQANCEAAGGFYAGDGTGCPDACLACGDPAAGDCFVDTGTPYCADGACCGLVCSLDDFCCEVSWDGLCADAAIANCQCGGPETGDCFVNNGTPWCDNGGCCDIVCTIDSFCCETSWDSICASLADQECTCPCDFDNDFDVDVDDLLFLLANWGGPGGDCNNDGTTDVNDLLALLAQWGSCP